MKPRESREAEVGGACLDGTPERVATRRIQTPLGVMLARASGAGVRELMFVDGEVSDAPAAAGDAARGHLERMALELGEYFSGTRRTFDVPLSASGSAFQRRVWDELGRIEFGRTITYGELARRVDDPDSTRAAAAACGQNQIAIVIPCHRVIAADGTMWGYAAGIARKAWLVEHEARVTGRYEKGLFEV